MKKWLGKLVGRRAAKLIAGAVTVLLAGLVATGKLPPEVVGPLLGA